MKINTDNRVKKDASDNTDMGYDEPVGGSMSRLLISKEVVELKKSSVHELVGLVQLLLEEKAVVLEEDLSPTEAGEIAGISRPVVMHLLKSGRLKGYEVGSHWRITKNSLLKYIEEREEFSRSMAKMDEAGFGIDQDE